MHEETLHPPGAVTNESRDGRRTGRGIAASALCLLLAAPVAWSHGAEAHGGEANAPQTEVVRATPRIDYARAEQKAFGVAADPERASRTVVVEMSDVMRFTPSSLTVRQGEIVKFVVVNRGAMLHEMVLGTMGELDEHAVLMAKFPGMEHDEPWMAHVAPGKFEIIGWQFTRPGVFHFGCLLPGHFDAGMIGKVTVNASPTAASTRAEKPRERTGRRAAGFSATPRAATRMN